MEGVICIQRYMLVSIQIKQVLLPTRGSAFRFTKKITETAACQSKDQHIIGRSRKLHCRQISCTGFSLTAATEDHEDDPTCADGHSLDLGAEEISSHKVKAKENALRWTDVQVQNLDVAQRNLIEELPPKMSGRSKAVIKHIICMTGEDDPYPLLMKWVKIMKPKRVDWLAVLKQLNLYDHPLFFKITEIALSEESFEPNIRDYTKLIDAYAVKGHLEDAERILVTVEDRGFICDAAMFTVLIRMYSKAGNFEKARDTFDKMRLSGLQLDQKAYGAMIMAYVRVGMPEAGESLIREMEAKDMYAGIEVYKALLKFFARQGNAVGAQRVFNAMQFAGILPNLNSCTLLIEAYAHAGDADQARAVFENMMKAGHKPDDKCTYFMVYAYEKKNMLGKALSLLMNLEKDGFKLGAATSALLIDWLGKLGFVEEAEQIFLEITQMGEVPSKVLVSLCDMYSRAGLHEKAINALDTMQNNLHALNSQEFEKLINGLLAGDLVDQAKKMHEQMQIHGLTPPESILL
ncbi:hypothetical protein SUGI_0662490 [Cryptomeria japonica]|nr:hypothetical protein SUGI_0662490 [Cryptomeria japonica]